VLPLILVLILLALLFGRGHAQPSSWSSHELGGTTYFDAEGPNGQRQHCESYRLGSTTYTDCRRASDNASSRSPDRRPGQ
jgi:hypothetical protein